MKNYKNFLITEDSDDMILDDVNTIDIQELAYYNIIDICNLENLKIDKQHKDKYKFGYCDYIKKFKDNPKIFSDNNYRFLIAIKNENLVGLFYKQVGFDKDIYGDGYILTSENGTANKMFLEMKKLGGYTTFSDLENIASIKAQLKIGAEILSLSSNPPDKANGVFNPNITDDKLLQLIRDEKIYYKDTYTNEDFFFMNKKGEIDISKLDTYLISNDDVKLVVPEDKNIKNGKDDIKLTGLKLYFYHKQK